MYQPIVRDGVMVGVENTIHSTGNPLHMANPHYNLYFFDGTKAAIIITGP